MDEQELTTKMMGKALNAIHDAAFEWDMGEDGYRDAINYIQGILKMMSALNAILHEE